MDQELVAFLDERFRETSQQILSLRTEMDARFKQVDEQFKDVHEQFKGVHEQFEGVHEQFRGVDGQFKSVHEEFRGVDGQLKSVHEEFKEVHERARQTLVIVEDLRDEIHLVAEAFMGTDERVTRLEKSEELAFETVKGMVEPFFKAIEERGREVDARSVQFDAPVKDLQNRVGVLEARATREDKKVMEAVAERLARGHAADTP